MAELAEQWGLRNKVGLKKPINKSQMHNILTNPFYCGIMKLKKDGAEYPHKYPTLIDRSLFERCQEVRLNWGKKPFK